MKDGIGKLIFVLTIIFILLFFSSPYLFIELWNIQSGRSTSFELIINDIKNDIDSAINKDKYNKILNEYIKNKFGDSLSKKFEIIKNNGRSYKVKFNDIMDETFYIAYNKGEHSCRDNFEQVILNDKKFKHLYSNWVKKQVGIDDENVEFEFTGTFDEPYIDFDKITTLSEDCREVFENTHNLYAWLCEVKNISSLTEENKIEKAKFAREKYLLPAMNITGITKDKKKYFGGHIDLSDGSFKKNEDLCFTFVFDARISDSELIEKRYWN